MVNGGFHSLHWRTLGKLKSRVSLDEHPVSLTVHCGTSSRGSTRRRPPSSAQTPCGGRGSWRSKCKEPKRRPPTIANVVDETWSSRKRLMRGLDYKGPLRESVILAVGQYLNVLVANINQKDVT